MRNTTAGDLILNYNTQYYLRSGNIQLVERIVSTF